MKFTTIKTTAVANPALATTQKPASIHPSSASNASSPSLTPSSAATNSTSIPVTSSSVPLPPLPLASLLTAARKFRFIYRECIALIRRLDLDRTVTLHLGAYPAFSTVLEAVERKVAAKEPTGPQLQFSLCTSLVDCITDLRALIGGLEPSRSALDSIDPESLRLAYFSLYSLLVEAVGLCRTLTPQPVRFRRRPSQLAQQQKLLQSPPQQHSQVLKGSPFSALARSKSQQIRSTASAAMLGRAPPPNPQHASQTAAIPSRQSSLSGGPLKRPPLKIDTTVSGVRRQDSELSVGSILIEAAGSSTALNSANPTSSSTMTLTDDEKLYEIIGYTIQESQVVFSQLNTAISKSAINTARDTEEGGEMNSGTNASSSNNGSPDLNHVAQKIKEMTLHCVASMEETKRIKATLMASRSVEQLDEDEQKRLYEETSLFLKSIINILAATKGAIQDIPALNEVRGALSNLTRATKELTIRLETSALKQAVISNSSSSTNLVEQPPLSSIPSVANFQPSGTSHTNTSPTRGTSSILSPVSLAKKTKIDLKDGITMQQYIQDLKAANSGHNEWSPMQTPVTTPLVASIGPAAASAVLPSAGSSHDLEHNPFDKMGKR
ncbi:DEKNAAC100099 [Brettanomyces naardenensis]|uniref:DEKNAAC100099 n=1 Tax=Brettanomyces naardenensis TaxID=13370 RepID=A0A448YEF0_BRENA|nr:DEKNAAC100099 [Brettanomyces naardenensis]